MMQNIQNQVLTQKIILVFLTKVSAFIFVGACLTIFVALVIWVTSGGNEGRNDSAVAMIKSALGMIVMMTIFYIVIVIYAKYTGISLQ